VGQRINLTNDDNAIYFNFHVISSKTADATAKMMITKKKKT